MSPEFTAALENASNPYATIQAELVFSPTSWSWMAVGGFDAAEIAVIGPKESIREALNLLGYRVTIRNEGGTILWRGNCNEVELSTGGIVISLNLEETYNRVAVNYVTPNTDGTETQGMTDWQDDAKSQALYGVRELLLSFEGTAADAVRFRSKQLVAKRYPKPQVRTESVVVGATLHCIGPWHKLAWQYYENLSGLEENPATGSGEQYLGASYTPSGSAIRFTAQDDIFDTNGLAAAGFDALEVGDTFYVSGAADAANNTTGEEKFTVNSIELAGSEGHIETVDKDRVTAIAAAGITLSREGVRVDRVAQSFTLTEDADDWTVATIGVRAQAIGSPTDNLVCELRADSAGSPGSLLDTASLTGSALPDRATWVEFTMSNLDALTFGTTYWIVLTRSGSNSLARYYIVDLDEDATYTGGVLRIWNGTSYVVRSPTADMPFRITGKTATTVQLTQMIEANAEFGVDSIVIRDASGIDTWQYRAGDTLALDEIDALLEQGTSAEERLLAEVVVEATGFSPERHIVIYKQPVASESDWLLNEDGTISQTVGGGVAPVEPGVSVAGRWLLLNIGSVADMLATAALFVERCEYVAADDQMHVESEATRRVWNLAKARQG